MSEFKGTKGEWRLQKERFGNFEVIAENGCTIAVVKNPDSFTNHKSRQEANARLIASAPAMLQTITENQRRLQGLIERTPTGEFRNELCDMSILCLHAMQLHQIKGEEG